MSRKPLREWVKENTPPAQKSSKVNNQENHDAFEWLIVHVVATGSNANNAPQPDGRASSKHSPAQLVEKIRTDFNGTSKSAVDRVAQIQINEELSAGPPLGQGPEDGDTGWGDLIFKLKSLILSSFDHRVRQYEEDIKEKESQRSLPGWNFNTFFVLKEGLAKGFESVGLVEDALTGYHELSVGLSSVTEARTVEHSAAPPADTLRTYTEELLQQYDVASQKQSTLSNGASEDDVSHSTQIASLEPAINLGDSIFDTSRKPFRELILANKLSAFDFQCYIFARQVPLLLRLASASSLNQLHSIMSKSEDAFDKDKIPSQAADPLPRLEPIEAEADNLLKLAEICELAVQFISYTSNTMRDDLWAGTREKSHHDAAITIPRMLQEDIVDNLVASWSFSVVRRTLDITMTQSLSTQLQPLMRQLRSRDGESSSSTRSPDKAKSLSQRPSFPDRSSSLSPSTGTIRRPPSPEKYPSLTSLDAVRLLPPGPIQTGAQDLAAHRADLVFLHRHVLSSRGLRCGGWESGWPDMYSAQTSSGREMQDVDLDEDAASLSGSAGSGGRISTKHGINDRALAASLDSETAFYQVYEEMTASILALYVLGGRKRSAEAATADIAAVRFYLGDYSAAASYFRQLAPFYAKGEWTDLELPMLHSYSRCLKHLDRKEEYVNIVLKLLAKQVHQLRTEDSAETSLSALAGQKPDYTKTLFKDIVAVSDSVQQSFSVPIERYFSGMLLKPQLIHRHDHDGFSMQLQLRNLVESFQPKEVKIRLINVGENQRSELWLWNTEPPVLSPGLVTMEVDSTAMIPGLYRLDKIAIMAGRITFEYDASTMDTNTLPIQANDPTVVLSEDISNESLIHIYSQPNALELQAYHCRDIHLEQSRSVEIRLSSGWNRISEGKLLVRAATAGLRLHTAETELTGGQLDIRDKTKPGNIHFGRLDPENEIKLKIPYNLESDLKEIAVRLEATYTTEHREFTVACVSKISISLVLGVNVQDIFKQEALFSKFSIFTANGIPLRLHRCHLGSTDGFAVESPPLDSNMDIFSRQPISLLAKINRQLSRSSDPKLQRKLPLQISYTCIDEEVTIAVSSVFTASLAESTFLHLSRLLLPILLSSLDNMFTTQDYETTALLRSVTLPPIQAYPYTSLRVPLAENYDAVLEWLHSWHKAHPAIKLPSPPTRTHRSLTIPVEVPILHVLHTASLTLSPSTNSMEYISIGNPIPAELHITRTYIWSHSTSPPKEPLEFMYEVLAPNDTWLIGGRRKGYFSAREHEELSFPLLLVPQRTGYLLYPGVEIRHVRSASSSSSAAQSSGEDGEGDVIRKADKRNDEEEEEPISSEIDYRSQAQSVLVIPGFERVTVGVDHEGSASASASGSGGTGNGNGNGGAAWVIETVPRALSRN